MVIDRRAVVARHNVHLRAPDPQHVLSVGNGDFAYTADITGMQSFTDYHDPMAALSAGSAAVNTATMSTWGWHHMPNPDEYTLDDAMTQYDSPRGTVCYPDKYDMEAAMSGNVADEHRAGAWLHTNPQRVDLGRIGLTLRPSAAGQIVTDPSELDDIEQKLDLWTGTLHTVFSYRGERVEVTTVASPDRATVAFRISTALFLDQRAFVHLAFPYPHDGFFQTDDWKATDKHESTLATTAPGVARIDRVADDTRYNVYVTHSNGAISTAGTSHTFRLIPDTRTIEFTVTFQPTGRTGAQADPQADSETFYEVRQRARTAWESFWTSGAAIDFAQSSDPRAMELERRVVLSQYLTRVHSAGSMPPQETGLVTNSWQGKSHLEMHFWHAAHFAAWGRPELLERSLAWYHRILPTARRTARQQGYVGARWPKHVGPDGRESPSPIGSLLIWQQPHILHLLELAWTASNDERRAALTEEYADIVEATADFMTSFADEREGTFHLGPPVMPAQEFYDARSTADPTFELSYWWWGLEVAKRWWERLGHPAREDWQAVQQSMAAPLIVDGRYAAVATQRNVRRDDHPSMLAALGVTPPNPLIDPAIMSATLDDVLAHWEWPTAWGWDFPVIAMTATRLGRMVDAFDALLRPEAKNEYTVVGHNPQMGGVLPLYLPGNGGVLLAIAHLASQSGHSLPEGWDLRSEGFPPTL